MKRLYKTDDNKMICGVCGGIAEYLGIDPMVVRLLTVIFALFAGSGLLVYIIAAFILPRKRDIM